MTKNNVQKLEYKSRIKSKSINKQKITKLEFRFETKINK